MASAFTPEVRRAVRLAQARADYTAARVRIADADLAGCDWLVTTHRGLFGITAGAVKTILHGWYFGIHRHGQQIYLFENCGHRDSGVDHGRIICLDLAGRQIVGARVLVNALHNNCHQIKWIDGLLCLVDTANQRILRYSPAGELCDVRQIVPPAPITDTTGGYRHINSIAQIDGRVVLVAHNGKVVPECPSELLWLDDAWQIVARHNLPGPGCHDVVRDDQGVLWHCDSQAGAIIASDGRRVRLSDRQMTRGLAISPTGMLVGLSSFGPRQLRDSLGGTVLLLDNTMQVTASIDLPCGPADCIAL
jgi:hypothetical protein